jgi:ABC-2 type transport system permease protein
MNWGLEAFYDVLLRNATFWDLIPELFLLVAFFIVTTTLALLYDKKKRAV